MGFISLLSSSFFMGSLRFTIQNLLKGILMVLRSHLSLLISKPYSFHEQIDISAHEYHPSPSLVPLPFHIITESIKQQLQVIEYSFFLESKYSTTARKQDDEDEPYCPVCLNFVQAKHEVRELCNCCHVFHRECLDTWIDKGHATCPLCRSNLFHDQGDLLKFKSSGGDDPWRRERMLYLFGEDYVMNTT